MVLGPTASGKSDLAVELAKKFSAKGGPASGWNGAEIISADSRQVYKGMDIGTGKITLRETRGVPHYLLSVASARKTFTVAQFQKLGRRAIKKILNKGKLPIICGGTGFYIDALLYNYPLPNVPPNIKLRKKLEKKTAESLFEKLERLDPERAASIDRHNKRRLIRALEIVNATGKPTPSRAEVLKRESDCNVLKIGIDLPKNILHGRIHARLMRRIRAGMIKEIENLHTGGLSWEKLDAFGLEYRYISRYLRGLITRQEMCEKLEREIWAYVKRQLTWWKRDYEIHWLRKPIEAIRLVRQFLL